MRMKYFVHFNQVSSNTTLVATQPGAGGFRVRAGTGRPSGSILRLGIIWITCYICSFWLSVAARDIVCADLSLRYTVHVAGTLGNKETTASLTPISTVHGQRTKWWLTSAKRRKSVTISLLAVVCRHVHASKARWFQKSWSFLVNVSFWPWVQLHTSVERRIGVSILPPNGIQGSKGRQ